jgi:hypothetical protein
MLRRCNPMKTSTLPHILTSQEEVEKHGSSTSFIRILLYEGETCYLPRTTTEIKVVAGFAWMAFYCRDIFLSKGQEMHLDTKNDFIHLSTIGRDPLIVEIHE